MADDSTTDVIRRYLKDAIAAENSFESQLRGFAKEGDDPQAHARSDSMRRRHAIKSKGLPRA